MRPDEQIYDAARTGKIADLKRLLAHRDAVYQPLGDGYYRPDGDAIRLLQTPLIVAVANGHTHIVQYLLSKENLKRAQVVKLIDMRSERIGGTALQCAVDKNDLTCVKLIMEAGGSLSPEQLLIPPFLNAISTNRAKIVDYLLNEEHPSREIVRKYIKDNGLEDLNPTCLTQPYDRNHRMLRLLLEADANVHKVNSKGKTLLEMSLNSPSVMAILLIYGAVPFNQAMFDAVVWYKTKITNVIINIAHTGSDHEKRLCLDLIERIGAYKNPDQEEISFDSAIHDAFFKPRGFFFTVSNLTIENSNSQVNRLWRLHTKLKRQLQTIAPQKRAGEAQMQVPRGEPIQTASVYPLLPVSHTNGIVPPSAPPQKEGESDEEVQKKFPVPVVQVPRGEVEEGKIDEPNHPEEMGDALPPAEQANVLFVPRRRVDLQQPKPTEVNVSSSAVALFGEKESEAQKPKRKRNRRRNTVVNATRSR